MIRHLADRGTVLVFVEQPPTDSRARWLLDYACRFAFSFQPFRFPRETPRTISSYLLLELRKRELELKTFARLLHLSTGAA